MDVATTSAPYMAWDLQTQPKVSALGGPFVKINGNKLSVLR